MPRAEIVTIDDRHRRVLRATRRHDAITVVADFIFGTTPVETLRAVQRVD